VVLPVICAPAARAQVARAADVGVASVGVRRGESSQATPECRFRARAIQVTVDVDSFPQPYFRLERTAIEDEQQFGTVRLEAAPVPITGIGIEAFWFPTEQKVMATEGRRLITVLIAWRGAGSRRREALAQAIVRRYLGRSDLAAADPNGS
jgi:hypothetical protein